MRLKRTATLVMHAGVAASFFELIPIAILARSASEGI
jgi:hypothetical protein